MHCAEGSNATIQWQYSLGKDLDSAWCNIPARVVVGYL